MNAELYTLLWYTRSKIVLIRKRDFSGASKIVFGKKGLTPEENLNNEVYELMGGIINTFDDILSSETMLWNAILLANLIQAFTAHAKNFKECHKASQCLGSTVLSLDNNYVRIKCHINVILSVLNANIISLCSSVPAHGSRRGSLLVPPICKHSINIAVTPGHPRSNHTNSICDSNKTCITTHRKLSIGPHNALSTHHNQPTSPPSTTGIKDIIQQHGCRRLKLCSKTLINAHDVANAAMVNSMKSEQSSLRHTTSCGNERLTRPPFRRTKSDFTRPHLNTGVF